MKEVVSSSSVTRAGPRVESRIGKSPPGFRVSPVRPFSPIVLSPESKSHTDKFNISNYKSSESKQTFVKPHTSLKDRYAFLKDTKPLVVGRTPISQGIDNFRSVIPAQAGIQNKETAGSRIKSGMTQLDQFLMDQGRRLRGSERFKQLKSLRIDGQQVKKDFSTVTSAIKDKVPQIRGRVEKDIPRVKQKFGEIGTQIRNRMALDSESLKQKFTAEVRSKVAETIQPTTRLRQFQEIIQAKSGEVIKAIQRSSSRIEIPDFSMRLTGDFKTRIVDQFKLESSIEAIPDVTQNKFQIQKEKGRKSWEMNIPVVRQTSDVQLKPIEVPIQIELPISIPTPEVANRGELYPFASEKTDPEQEQMKRTIESLVKAGFNEEQIRKQLATSDQQKGLSPRPIENQIEVIKQIQQELGLSSEKIQPESPRPSVVYQRFVERRVAQLERDEAAFKNRQETFLAVIPDEIEEDGMSAEEIVARIPEETRGERSEIIESLPVPLRDGSRDQAIIEILEHRRFENSSQARRAINSANANHPPVRITYTTQRVPVTEENVEEVFQGQEAIVEQLMGLAA